MNLKYATARKLLIFTFLILHFTFNLRLQAEDVIVDTVSSISTLDASLTFNTQWGYWLGGAIMPNGPYGFGVGDSYSGYNGGDEIRRSFITFPVQETPEGYTLISANIVLWFQVSYGNSVFNQWPIWNIDDEEINYPMLIEHVDYGYTFEIDDFYCDTLTSYVEEFYSDNTQCFMEINITAPYIYNISTDSMYSQYRLRFPIDTDYDESNDYLGFAANNIVNPYKNPKLVLTYESTSNTLNESVPGGIVINATNFPNPFNPSTIIFFSLTTECTENTEVEIYNVKGQKIKSIVCHPELACPERSRREGRSTIERSITWNGTDQSGKPVASGIYYAALKNKNKILISRKMLLLK